MPTTITTTAGRTIQFDTEALRAAESAGVNIDADIEMIQAQLLALPIRDEDSIAAIRDSFTAECVDGAEDAQTIAAWTEYAATICSYAEGPDDCAIGDS